MAEDGEWQVEKAGPEAHCGGDYERGCGGGGSASAGACEGEAVIFDACMHNVPMNMSERTLVWIDDGVTTTSFSE